MDEHDLERELVAYLVERFHRDLQIPLYLAVELAMAHRSPHDAEDLIKDGCDPKVAAEILL